MTACSRETVSRRFSFGRSLLMLAVAVGAARVDPAVADPPQGVAGLWLTEDTGGVIEIGPCGDALCGRIVGTAERARAQHPDEPSPCGRVIMTGFQAEGSPERSTEWGGGRITDPRDGSVYRARFALTPDGALRLRGYIGISLFGASQLWTRYTGWVGTDCRMWGRDEPEP
jgi:uncharacterized protein (DUF2147 family)